MTVFISCKELSKSHSHTTLFEALSFTISKGDRIGVVGPNGSGKSTLLRILAEEDHPNTGSVVRKQSLRVGYVPQSSTYPERSVQAILVDKLKDQPFYSTEQDKCIAADTILGKLGFEDTSVIASALSGGWKKRLDIAQALVIEPDLLLLDEPTNHLDIASIVWLENLLLKGKYAYFVVSHDRLFLDRISNKIFEINRAFPKGIFVSEGNYTTFLEKRTEFFESLAQYEQGLRSKVRNEEAWLRQSPAARTTKQQARIQQAYALQDELQQLRSTKAPPKEDWQFGTAGLQSRKLVVAKNLSKSLGDRVLFKGLDLILSPGTRLGIAGDNGSGKTTLLKLLMRELEPDLGTVKYAEGVRLVYFDQHREKLPNNQTLKDCLSPNGDTVEYRGKEIHVNGWAKRFHFRPERMLMPVSQLSGGEKARILLAKLMLKPADVLLLDEPTNDLDIETLEVLEESLIDFPGAVVLITHDRQMLDNVSTQIIGLGCGEENYSFADVNQWEKAKLAYQKKSVKTTEKIIDKPISAPARVNKPKLSYKEQQELQQMELKITQAEDLVSTLERLAQDANTQHHPKKLEEVYKQLADAHKTVDQLYQRWEELESKTNF